MVFLFYFFTFDKNNHSYELITNWTNSTSEPSCIIHSGSNKTYDIITRPIPSESIHNNLVSSTAYIEKTTNNNIESSISIEEVIISSNILYQNTEKNNHNDSSSYIGESMETISISSEFIDNNSYNHINSYLFNEEQIESTYIPSEHLDIFTYYNISILSSFADESIATISILSENNILNITKEQLIENLTDIIKDKEIDKIYELDGEDYKILIYPTNATTLSKKTHVNFEKCESILREYYHFGNSSILTFCQIEIENPNEHSLINQLEYKVYDEHKKELNLSICNNVNVQVVYSMKNDTNLDISKINSFKDSPVDIFDINDDFFNDVCQPYSDSGNDLILEDRIKNIYQNFSLCEEGCIYNDISLENMTVSCECKVKESINIIISEINMDYIKGVSTTNFDIIKCYNLVFSLDGKKENIGFWIFTFLIIAHIPFLILYFMRGIKPIKEYLFKEMVKYGYIRMIKDNKTKTKKGKSSPPKHNKNKNNKRKHNKIIKNNNLILIDSSIINNINMDKSKNKLTNKKIKDINDDNLYKYLKNNIKSHQIKRAKKKLNKKSLKKCNNKKQNIVANIPTEGIENNKQDNKQIDNEDLNLISINLNLSRKKKYYPNNSLITLYNYTMQEAFIYDKRDLFRIFYIILLSKQAIFHAFLYSSPLEVFSLRICRLFFIISSDLALNAFFYFNDNISEKYKTSKSLIEFTFTSNITVILLSTFVGFILMTFLLN